MKTHELEEAIKQQVNRNYRDIPSHKVHKKSQQKT